MGFFSRLAGAVWSGVKRVAKAVWTHAVRPAVEWVADKLGISGARAFLDRVEQTAARVVEVLELDLGPVLRQALDAVQARLERWLVHVLGAQGVLLVDLLRRLEEIFGVAPQPAVTEDLEVEPAAPIVVADSPEPNVEA